MILILYPNPTLHKTIRVDRFRLGGVYRPQSITVLPGGKGITVARALQALGDGALVCGWAGGASGLLIESALQREGINTAFVRVPHESRTCLTILDTETGRPTEIYERGEAVREEDQVNMLHTLADLFRIADSVVMVGTLPPGVPVDFFARAMVMARHASLPVLFDSAGEALRLGLEKGHPDLVKPTRFEASALLGREIHDAAEAAQAALELSRRYDCQVVIPMGAEGLAASMSEGVFQALPPEEAGGAPGSGDAVMAALAVGASRGLMGGDILAFAAAAGAANALCAPARFSREDVEAIQTGVELRAYED